MSTPAEDDAASVVVTRVVHPGHEREFATWADDIDRAAARFAGHQGGVRLHDDQGLNHLVYHFDSTRHLRAWETSSERRNLIARGDRISDEERSVAGGRDTWFQIPGRSTPPRWKTFLIIWAAVYPTLLIIATGLDTLAPDLPQPAALAISSATLTALLTWVILPRLTHRTRSWLLRGAQPQHTRRPPDR
ncbi:hypothetical protein [Brachybacterium sacelli]|uniref:Antibiotic biosynthesis monooxygenase (ABM) superfamily enzyme n=1 Tax=Brachybacterium sacelli TaxID=173364 RepID=A0ABS4X9K8_9MICO|nr:hypothetical protein [Brachybacterium sacelli]MBP2384354.1 antibiotic biosynthesis monooxygenase (ABM) superfamily enzyme [Brachybacterium sacelli]